MLHNPNNASLARCLSAWSKRRPVPLIAALKAALVSLASAGAFTLVQCFADHVQCKLLSFPHTSDIKLGSWLLQQQSFLWHQLEKSL